MEPDKARKLAEVLQGGWCELNPGYVNEIYDFLITLPDDVDDDTISDMLEFQKIVDSYDDWLADQ